MKNVIFKLIAELGILFSIIYIMFTGLTTNNEIVEIICYCTIVIIAVVEWRNNSKSSN